MRLVLVRHGQTTSNVAGALDTAEPGASLTDLGREQARALVPALADEPIEAVYVSTLVRTHETIAPVAEARGLVPVVRRGLREIQAGDLEMATDHESVMTYVGTVAAWFEGDLDRGMPGGEDGRGVLDRFDTVVAEIAARGIECVAVVSHGAILRTWASIRGENVDAVANARTHLSNTGVIVVEGEPGDWRLVSWEGDAVGGEAVSDVAHDGPQA